MTRILITGVNGFVGRHLVRELVNEGAALWGAGLQAEPFTDAISYEAMDLSDTESFVKFVAREGFDEIYHLAAFANPRQSNERPAEAVRANVLGSQSVFEAARLNPRMRVLFVGTSDSYAVPDSGEIVLSESAELKPRSVYSAGKIAAEIIGKEYARQYGCAIAFTRSFNHTGPGQSPDYVLSDWARQCVLISLGRQTPVVEAGNIDVRRDFLDVRDVVRAYVLLNRRATPGEVYNVAGGESFGLRFLLEKLISIAGLSGVAIRVDPARIRKSEPALIRGDNAKLRERTAWVRTLSIDETLSDLVSYWRSELS